MLTDRFCPQILASKWERITVYGEAVKSLPRLPGVSFPPTVIFLSTLIDHVDAHIRTARRYCRARNSTALYSDGSLEPPKARARGFG